MFAVSKCSAAVTWRVLFLLLGLIVLPRAAHPAGVLVADGGFGGLLDIESHEVQVTINNGITVTDVTQVFRNTEDRQVEALYIFPVPKGASISNFSMWINGQEMIGEVVEKERARQIYDSYKRRGRDPGLLEQVDYKTFEMRIFPIGPRAEQRVTLTYCQELDFDHDWATYVYPLATTARKDMRAKTTGRFSFKLDVHSDVPIAEMSSPSHEGDVVVARQTDSYYQASLETHAGDLNRDVVVAYRTSRPKTGVDVMASSPKGEDGYFAITLTAGEEIAEHVTAMDFVYILDISGSMAHEGKLELSRNSIGAFLEALAPEDRFEIVTFNIDAHPLFSALQPASDENMASAQSFLAEQQARGGTSLQPALSVAYRYGDPDRPLNIVILSDGMTEQAERSVLLGTVSQRPTQAKIFCIGIGNEINRPLLQQVAEEAGGLAAFLSRGDDLERQARAFRRKLTHPVATNLRLTFDGIDAYDLEPPVPPNLFHGCPLRVYGRFRGPGQGKLRVAADVFGVPIQRATDIDLRAASDTPEIERMWAWQRTQRLLRDQETGARQNSTIDEVVRLGEAYSIASEYASFIVLENNTEYQRWKIDRLNALRVQRDRTSREQVLSKLQTLRDQRLAGIGPLDPETVRSGVDASMPGTVSAQPGQDRQRRFDIDVPGGGALDPISAAVMVGLGALACVRRSRRGNRSSAEAAS
jgi:Ca-activated chloride channel family protein